MKASTMEKTRIKVFTRSFDLKLYRYSTALCEALADEEGTPVPRVRLTDQSADGYFLTMLRDKTCDVAINIDEDAFLVDPKAVIRLVRTVVANGYANAGYSEKDRGFDERVTNPFFNILNLKLIRTRFHAGELKRELDDPEPYYPFFRWIATHFKVLYLPSVRHTDGITTRALDPDGNLLLLHTWYARFYSMPAPLVRRLDPAGAQKRRIDAIIREAYALRNKELPVFGPADRLAFAGNTLIRWMVKIPQRIGRWPYKIYRKFAK